MNNRGVVWKFYKRTINITEYRNGKDEVNPAKNRTFGGITNHSIPCSGEFAAYIFQPLTLEFWIVWLQKNKGCILFAAPASVHEKQLSRQGFHSIFSAILQEQFPDPSENSLPNRLFPLQWLHEYRLSRWVPSQLFPEHW